MFWVYICVNSIVVFVCQSQGGSSAPIAGQFFFFFLFFFLLFIFAYMYMYVCMYALTHCMYIFLSYIQVCGCLVHYFRCCTFVLYVCLQGASGKTTCGNKQQWVQFSIALWWTWLTKFLSHDKRQMMWDKKKKTINSFLTDDLVLFFFHDVSGQNCVPSSDGQSNKKKGNRPSQVCPSEEGAHSFVPKRHGRKHNTKFSFKKEIVAFFVRCQLSFVVG